MNWDRQHRRERGLKLIGTPSVVAIITFFAFLLPALARPSEMLSAPVGAFSAPSPPNPTSSPSLRIWTKFGHIRIPIVALATTNQIPSPITPSVSAARQDVIEETALTSGFDQNLLKHLQKIVKRGALLILLFLLLMLGVAVWREWKKLQERRMKHQPVSEEL